METIKRMFKVNRQDINYIRTTIESYDGLAMVSTINPLTSYIEIKIAPGCEDIVIDLLDSLRKVEGLDITSVHP